MINNQRTTFQINAYLWGNKLLSKVTCDNPAGFVLFLRDGRKPHGKINYRDKIKRLTDFGFNVKTVLNYNL